MKECEKLTTVAGCYDDGAGSKTSVSITRVFGTDATGATITVSTAYTDSANTVIAGATAANVTTGACPVASPDVEWTNLCDALADGSFVEFSRQVVTSFDTSGAVVAPSVVTDYELDQVTPYSVVGTAGECGCAPSVAVGVVATF